MNILQGKDKTLDYQLKLLKKILFKNKDLLNILISLDNLGINNYYVGAGCINQTVFNYYHGYEANYGIEDYDIVYFDKDTSYESEDIMIKKISKELECINVSLDIKNQARVHLWYEKKFGHKIDKNLSVEDAISKWGTTITSIGVKLIGNKLVVYAPYGLNDLYKLILRPNKTNYIKKDYDKKVLKWKEKWPLLEVIPWDEA